jgi:hypothetical protein
VIIYLLLIRVARDMQVLHTSWANIAELEDNVDDNWLQGPG